MPQMMSNLVTNFTSAANTSAQNVTGLTAALSAPGSYLVHGSMPWSPAGTVGGIHTVAATFSGTASGRVAGFMLAGTTPSSGGSATAYTAGIASPTHSGTAGVTVGICEIDWWLVVTAPGNFQVTVANSISADDVSILAGSYLSVYRFA